MIGADTGGPGWLLEKYARLMATFGWSLAVCRWGYPAAQTQAFYYWALENTLTAFGPVWRVRGPTYTQQEVRRRLASTGFGSEAHARWLGPAPRGGGG